jgi:hypothetical protein
MCSSARHENICGMMLQIAVITWEQDLSVQSVLRSDGSIKQLSAFALIRLALIRVAVKVLSVVLRPQD